MPERKVTYRYNHVGTKFLFRGHLYRVAELDQETMELLKNDGCSYIKETKSKQKADEKSD